MGRSRKPLYGQLYRGFESHPLRHFLTVQAVPPGKHRPRRLLRYHRQVRGRHESSEETSMNNVIVSDHPLVQHKLSILRDRNTSVRDFRQLCAELSMLLAFEAMRDL